MLRALITINFVLLSVSLAQAQLIPFGYWKTQGPITIFSRNVVGSDPREYSVDVQLSALGITASTTAVQITAGCGQGQLFIAIGNTDTEYAPGLPFLPRNYESSSHVYSTWPYAKYGYQICTAGNNQQLEQNSTMSMTITGSMLTNLKVRVRNDGGGGNYYLKIRSWN